MSFTVTIERWSSFAEPGGTRLVAHVTIADDDAPGVSVSHDVQIAPALAAALTTPDALAEHVEDEARDVHAARLAPLAAERHAASRAARAVTAAGDAPPPVLPVGTFGKRRTHAELKTTPAARGRASYFAEREARRAARKAK